MVSTLLWFRRDLRLSDNPALYAAGADCAALYIDDPADPNAQGGAGRWFCGQALRALAADGLPLRVERGEPLAILRRVLKETGAGRLVFNRLYDPYARARDARIEAALTKAGLQVETFNASLLVEPRALQTKSGGAFKIFTPFAKACWAEIEAGEDSWSLSPQRTASSPRRNDARGGGAAALEALFPVRPWAETLGAFWCVGERAAQARLRRLIEKKLHAYKQNRDRPDLDGTSLLSPDLHFGTIGPRQVWRAVRHVPSPGGEAFLRQLLWREFSAHLLWHNPQMSEQPLHDSFRHFAWRKDPAALAAWQRGQTGYPIVDAGMRQLWLTGWMHNRVRMIAASFLVKDLLLPWQVGLAWFADTLVDADEANNAASWQWVAGCGTDAAPYFRIFNPVLQGQKFDPDGAYVRRYVPELKGIKGGAVHAPWLLDEKSLQKAGVILNKTYPRPIVDHAVARARALETLRRAKKT